MITINVTTNLSALSRCKSMLEHPAELVRTAAETLAVELRRHFAVRESEGNSMGWPSKHFWNREGKERTSVTEVTDTHGTVTVASPAVAHKLAGGTIRPGPGKKALAIPLTAAAYKAGSPRTGVIPGMFIVKRKGAVGRAFLAVTVGKGKSAHIEPMYLLVPSVTQRADPRTLPAPAALESAVNAAVDAKVARELRR